MNLLDKAKHHWHVPTATLSFLKWLLENRKENLPLHIHEWKEVLQHTVLTKEEEDVLVHVLKRIEPSTDIYSLETLFSLIKDTSMRYWKDKYVLLKYTKGVTYEDSWNEWYTNVRGCVVDLENMTIVSATLPKFFNVDEKSHTSYTQVMNMVKKGHTTIYDKQDGSCVSVSYGGDLIVTTPGSFESQQVDWSRLYLTKNHEQFLEELQSHHQNYTFVFEYVSPQNRIVVQYDKQDMVLLHMIDKRTGDILPYETVAIFAKKYGFTVCSVVDTDLHTLKEEKDDASLYAAQKQEGWVIRIDLPNQVFLVKMKCADYIKLHRTIANVLQPRWVQEAMIQETLDDTIASVERQDIKDMILHIRDTLKEWEKIRKEEIEQFMQHVPSELWIESSILSSYQTYQNEIEQHIPKNHKQDAVRSFLHQFSKGKMKNPKEEIRIKAKLLWDKKLINEDVLLAYESYKTNMKQCVARVLKEMKKEFNDYALEGIKKEPFSSYFDEMFSMYYHWKHPYEKAEEWDAYFEEHKEKYLRMWKISESNLAPSQHEMSQYAKKKYAFAETIANWIPALRNEFESYYMGETEELHPVLLEMTDASLRIGEELKDFLQEKEDFENNLSQYVAIQDEAEKNSIVKELYNLIRGQEHDDSYEIAKEIFQHISPAIQNQTLYFQKRGQFSSYVNRNVPHHYRQILFELFDVEGREKENYMRECSLLQELVLLVDGKREPQHDFEMDMSDISKQMEKIAEEE